jgi:hypothetical protein
MYTDVDGLNNAVAGITFSTGLDGRPRDASFNYSPTVTVSQN